MISGVILDQNSKPVPQTLKSREDWNFGRQRLYLAHGFEHRQELRCLAQRFLIVKSCPRHGGMRGASISNARVRAWSPFLSSSPRDRRCVLVAPGTSKRSCAVRAGLIRKRVCQGVPVYAKVCQDMPRYAKQHKGSLASIRTTRSHSKPTCHRAEPQRCAASGPVPKPEPESVSMSA